MPENLMCAEHKSNSDKYRENWERTFKSQEAHPQYKERNLGAEMKGREIARYIEEHKKDCPVCQPHYKAYGAIPMLTQDGKAIICPMVNERDREILKKALKDNPCPKA